MRRVVVGLYCAVVDRPYPLVSTRTIAAGETRAVFNQRVESLRMWLAALNLGSGEGWQRKSESSAARALLVRPQSSAVGVNDGAADREANSHSASLGGIEGFENSLAILGGDARA
jgi:hypothetical protein